MKVENKPRWFQRLDDNGDVVFDLTKVLKASLIFVLSFFILMSCSVFMISYWGHPKIMSANEVGDAFGVANAFFSALAFSLLIYTSLLQREELKLQREEMRESRHQFKRLADVDEANLTLQQTIYSNYVQPKFELKLLINPPESKYQFSIKIHSVTVPFHLLKVTANNNRKLLEKSIWLYHGQENPSIDTREIDDYRSTMGDHPLTQDDRIYTLYFVLRTIVGETLSYAYTVRNDVKLPYAEFVGSHPLSEIELEELKKTVDSS